MVSVLVHHVSDREARMLVAVLRRCDSDRRFQYLPVDGASSATRLRRFLERYGLRPEAVPLPFVILMDGERPLFS